MERGEKQSYVSDRQGLASGGWAQRRGWDSPEALKVGTSALPEIVPGKRLGLAFFCSADDSFSEDGK